MKEMDDNTECIYVHSSHIYAHIIVQLRALIYLQKKASLIEHDKVMYKTICTGVKSSSSSSSPFSLRSTVYCSWCRAPLIATFGLSGGVHPHTCEIQPW